MLVATAPACNMEVQSCDVRSDTLRIIVHTFPSFILTQCCRRAPPKSTPVQKPSA